jgi:hypothetical protein
MILNSIDIYQYHLAQKHSPKSSTHDPNFEVYVYFFIFYDQYYFVENMFHTFKFVNFFCIVQNN